MFNLISNYFSIARLKAQFKNKNLSWLMFYDVHTKISSKSAIQRFVIIRQSNIGEFSYIGHNSNIFRATIGKFCSVSRYVNIGLSSHPSNFLSTSPIFFSSNNAIGYKWIDKDAYDDQPAPIFIGNDVWIGMNATIMGGVNVGNGAIVAAHSVVTKDVPPYAIVAGVPAKIIRYRFDNLLISKLESICWWDMPESVLKKNISIFMGELQPENLDQLIVSK
jgi:acetyltransferase-like isoleucine patch superfamily enzyme